MLDFSNRSTPNSPMRSWRIVSLLTMLLLTIAVFATFRRQTTLPASTSKALKPAIIDPALDQKFLTPFEDHSRSINFQAYYYLLDRARRADPTKLVEQAGAGVTYAQLLDESDRFRGVSLHLVGRLFRLIDYKSQANNFGIHRQYEGWLYTPGAGSFPYCLIMADQPRGIPMGEGIYTPVDVTGYFLGWWRYTTKEGKRTSAPIVAVCQIRAQNEPLVSNSPPIAFSPAVAWLVVGIAVAVSLATWWWQRPSPNAPAASVSTDQLVFLETQSQETEKAALGEKAEQPLDHESGSKAAFVSKQIDSSIKTMT